MITFITGVPGAGKTALCVDMMLREGEGRGRHLIVDGIAGLTIPAEPLPPIDVWTTHVEDRSSHTGQKLVFNPAVFPPGCIVIIDECQRVFPLRSAASKVPAFVSAFETHRHQGIDFWLLSQHPGLVDGHVRKLVQRHIHIHNTFMGRALLEWTQMGEPDNRTSRELAARRRYRLPKRVFSMYRSAEVHTKVRKRMPMYVYVFFFALVSLIVAGGMVYRNISEKTNPGYFAGRIGDSKDGASKLSALVHSPQAHVPRIEGLAFTAPVYDTVTQVKSAPFPAACILKGPRCGCYTEQATVLVVPDQLCRQIVRDGIYRDFAPPAEPQKQPVFKAPEPKEKGSVKEPLPTSAVLDYKFTGSHTGGPPPSAGMTK